MPQSKIIHHFCGCISDFYLLCYWSQNTTLPHPLLPCEVLVNEEDEIIMRFLSFFPSYSLCSPCKLREPHTHPASAFLKSFVVSTSLDWLLVSLLPHGSMSVSQQRRIYPPDQTTVNWYQVSGVGAELFVCLHWSTHIYFWTWASRVNCYRRFMGDLPKWEEQSTAWNSMPQKMLKKNNDGPKRSKSDHRRPKLQLWDDHLAQ